jgi:hypothetical protein
LYYIGGAISSSANASTEPSRASIRDILRTFGKIKRAARFLKSRRAALSVFPLELFTLRFLSLL